MPGHRRVTVCHTDAVAAVTVPLRRIHRALSPVVLVVVMVIGLAGSAGAGSSRPLRPPKTTDAQDTRYFTDVAEADPALGSYEQTQENVALRALLTDGSAFCALLERERNLNAALVAEATGARSTEAQTHLPLSVTTFNTIESVSLLTLCPSEQKLLPAPVRAKIRRLAKTFAKPPG